jgi:hypothetical protein
MELLQFAVPRRAGEKIATAVSLIAGGATLLEGVGWWVNGNGVVEREPVNLLVVGVEEKNANLVVETVKELLRGEGERAVWYVKNGKPILEWLQ